MVIMKKLHIAGIRLFHYLKYQCYRYSAWEHPKALKIIYGIVIGTLLFPLAKSLAFIVFIGVCFISFFGIASPIIGADGPIADDPFDDAFNWKYYDDK